MGMEMGRDGFSLEFGYWVRADLDYMILRLRLTAFGVYRFMIFPFATGHVSDQQKVDKTRLGLMSGVLVTLGCIGLVVVCFAVRNWIFQLHFAAR